MGDRETVMRGDRKKRKDKGVIEGETRTRQVLQGGAAAEPLRTHFNARDLDVSLRIARELGRPIVGTADVHYLRKEDYHHHTALLCVQTKSTLQSPKMTFDTNEFFLKSNEEMAQSFSQWPEALASTIEIAERCDVQIELGQQLIPHYPTPLG